ncbi:MAG: ABC transporter ATP-binding protein [Firmicutes bacterium]|nr:ABC transporter ATP-binding protein [Bacillota bacterium]
MLLKGCGISKRYFRKTKKANYFYAVQKTDIEIVPGNITVITGRSGSGKSTLLNMLAGLLEPPVGKVYFVDKAIYSMNDKEISMLRNEKIGIIPQGQTGLASLTVLENVMLPYCMYKKKENVDKYAEELLETVGIKELANAYPSELSGGENRRAAIARALIQNPDVVLADEPTGDLDDENTRAVLELLRKTADNGKAIMLVTHENEALAYADKVYKMDAGVLSGEDT